MSALTAATVRDALEGATDAIAASGSPSARLDAELLLAEATGIERVRMTAEPETTLPAGSGREFAAMVRRRVAHEPVAYVLGRKGFRHLELEVDRSVLIPRPETELLVEVALELRPGRVLDVGTGSGAVALAIADELPEADVVATDTSQEALAVAGRNAGRLGIGLEDLIRTTYPASEGPFDLVVANLPYVTEAEWAGLEPDVREYEPRDALVSGPEGLETIRAVLGEISEAAAVPLPGAIALEVGIGQAPAVAGARRGSRVRSSRGAPGPCRDRAGGRGAAAVNGFADAERGARVLSVAREGADAARAALEETIGAGGVAVFPADTLYGLACDPLNERAIERIHAIKGRDDRKPSAVLYFSPLAMRELVAGMAPRTRDAVSALLPGPVTLVIANRERRYPLACREDPERLGVRLIGNSPLAGAMTPLFQTSANLSGEPAPHRFEAIPPAIVGGADLAIDGGGTGRRAVDGRRRHRD